MEEIESNPNECNNLRLIREVKKYQKRAVSKNTRGVWGKYNKDTREEGEPEPEMSKLDRVKYAKTRTFRRRLKTGLTGKYKPEVVEFVKKSQGEGDNFRQTGQKLYLAGMTECTSPVGWGTMVKSIVVSKEYQDCIGKQLGMINEALMDKKKYEEAPLKDLVAAQCNIAKTFGGAKEEGEGSSYTVNFIKFEKSDS